MSKEYSLVVVFVLAVLAVGVAFIIRGKQEQMKSKLLWFYVSVVLFGDLAGAILGIDDPSHLGWALLLLIAEVLLLISPPPDAPRLFVQLMKIGAGIVAIAFWADIVRTIIYPSGEHYRIPYSLIIPEGIGLLIIIIALVFLRPRGRKQGDVS